MALPTSGPISLGQIQTEFGGSAPTQLGEYYRGGAYVTQNNTNVPTSGVIACSNFYSASRAVQVTITFTRSATLQNYFYLDSPGLPRITITTTVDGAGSVLTYFTPTNIDYTVTANVPNNRIRLVGNTMQLEDGADTDFNDLTITPNLGTFSQIGSNFYYRVT
jgi:hypothetical protein